MREASIDDAEFILKLVNEPAWHEFISNHSINTLEEASEYIELKMVAMYQQFDFGLWVVETVDNAIPIGICGLLKRDSLPSIDLGFAFLSRHWGQGFAYEASICCLKYAEFKLGMQTILAITNPSNKRSVNLLRKMGFQYDKTYSHPGSDEILSLYAKT